MDGKENISAKKLKNEAIFKGLTGNSLERFNQIAGLDGDASTFNAEELRVLYSMADASLKDDSFVFDGEYSTDKASGLEQTSDKELDAVVKHLVKNNVQKRTESINLKGIDRTKDFASKVTSDNADESMLALHDKVQTGFTDKRTGKPVSIIQAVMLFEDFVSKPDNKGYKDFYNDVSNAFTEETGIPVSDFSRLRCVGDGDSFVIGDWEYNRGNIKNSKTGESITLKRLTWRNSTDHTIPAANGRIGIVNQYNDGKGTVITYNYDDPENLAPSGANVTTNGSTQTVQYKAKEAIDPDIYNFIEK